MERLEYLLSLIEKYEKDESGFKLLYRELIKEIHTQRAIDPDRNTNSYLNNLEQTWEKEMLHYFRCTITQKEMQKQAWQSFISHFEQDIREILSKFTF